MHDMVQVCKHLIKEGQLTMHRGGEGLCHQVQKEIRMVYLKIVKAVLLWCGMVLGLP